MKKIAMLVAVFGFAAAVSASAAEAKDNWDTLCAKCHGADGKGQTKMGQKLGVKDFTDAKVQAAITDDGCHQGHQGRKEKCGWQHLDEAVRHRGGCSPDRRRSQGAGRLRSRIEDVKGFIDEGCRIGSEKAALVNLKL